jgi:hypothetical protein
MSNTNILKFLTSWVLCLGFARADVVKPALVEISVLPNYKVELAIDLSLEAAMSDISTQYKGTEYAPNANKYNELRALQPKILLDKFLPFSQSFLESIELKINDKVQKLTLSNIDIAIKGYVKRPRKTVLKYRADNTEAVKTIQWQFRKSYGDSAVRYQILKKEEYNWNAWQWLRNGTPSGVIEVNQVVKTSQIERLLEFVAIGFDHVIPLGWDHILFIIGMALSSLLWRRLLLLVSTFTLAHTLTLGLAMLEVVEISPMIIEPLIAFSIVYVAIENLLVKQSIRRKTLVVFLFGLIHGLGFASMLKSFNMNEDNFITTLVGFNVGVELAQVAIVLGIVFSLLLLRRLKLDYHKFAVKPISVIIALIGMYWGFERIFVF